MVRVGKNCGTNEIIFFLDDSEDSFITCASFFNCCVSQNKEISFLWWHTAADINCNRK